MAQQRDGSAIVSLRKLIENTMTGFYQIPELQREFVWDSTQRLNLYDSVNRGIPIGSLMVWRTRDDKTFPTRPNIGTSSIPRPEPGRPHDYVIDGLQRLTTLMLALAPRSSSEQIAQDGSDDIFFDLSDPNPEHGLPLRLRRQGAQLPPSLIPLHILFDPVGFRDFQIKLLRDDHREWLEESERLANRFRDYEIPIVALMTDDKDLVAETFVRINSSGRRIEELDFLRALLWAENVDLPQCFDRTKMELETLGWGALSTDVLLVVLKVLLKGDPSRSHPWDLVKKLTLNPTVIERLPEVLVQTVSLLNGFGVCGPEALPSAFQLAALARAIFIVGESIKGTSAASRLERWFFQTAYTGHLDGLTGNQLLPVFEHVEEVIEEPTLETRPKNMNTWVRSAAWGSVSSPPLPASRHLLHALLLARESDRRWSKDNCGQADTGADQPHARQVGMRGQQALIPIMESRSKDGGSLVVCSPEVLRMLRAHLREKRPLPSGVRPEHYLFTKEMLNLYWRGDRDQALDLRQKALNALEKQFVESLGLQWGYSSRI